MLNMSRGVLCQTVHPQGGGGELLDGLAHLLLIHCVHSLVVASFPGLCTAFGTCSTKSVEGLGNFIT